MIDSQKTCCESFDFQGYLDQQLTLPQRIKLEKHVKECLACRAQLQSMQSVFSVLIETCSPGLEDGPAAGQVQRVMNTVRTLHQQPVKPIEGPTVFQAIRELIKLQRLLMTGMAVCAIVLMAFLFNRFGPGQVDPQVSILNKLAIPTFRYTWVSKPVSADLNKFSEDSGALEPGEHFSLPLGGVIKVVFREKNVISLSHGAQFVLDKEELILTAGDVECNFEKSGRGFVIQTKFGSVTSYGTVFHVRSCPGYSEVELVKGEIILRTPTRTIVLKTPGKRFFMPNGVIQKSSDSSVSVGLPPVVPSSQPGTGDTTGTSGAGSLNQGF